jgi:hypothetical protein
MTEEKTETKPLLVGEMDVEAFFAIMVQMLDRRVGVGDGKLMDMTVKEFTATMIETFKTRAFATATAETSVAERILTDWQGLKDVGAVTQPFRIFSATGAEAFGAEMAAAIAGGMKGEFVIAVAVVSPEGGYAGRPR